MRATKMIAAMAALILMMGMAACTSQRANAPAYKDAVKQSLDNNGFKDVSVSEDREKGVIALGGRLARRQGPR